MIIESSFRPPSWLRNPHIQTIVAGRMRPQPPIRVQRERIELPDGDFIDVDWTAPLTASTGSTSTPIVVIIHGLGGSVESRYARGMLNAVSARGWRAVLVLLRGASGEPNRQPRGYHSGDTADVGFFIDLIRQREPSTPIAAVGYSMGGNILLKLLGERGDSLPLVTGVAVSVPYDLSLCAHAINRGFSRIYQRTLVNELRRLAEVKFSNIPPPFEVPDMDNLRDFFAFDDAITAPLNGFASAQEYYDTCSSRHFLKDITIPTLAIHALDDPFMTPEVVPTEAELSPAVTLELSRHGGHVAFISAGPRRRPQWWLETRIPQHFAQYFPQPLPEHRGDA